MRVILIGAPGSGKGTQAKLIGEKFSIPHISSGDMLRKAVENKTPLGREAESYMQQGALVPDKLVIAMIMERISKEDAQKGFLLDGFPRTLAQAAALDEAMSKSEIRIDKVLYFDVSDNELILRTSGRRMDPETGKIYHINFNPPPQEIADRVIHRSDDLEEVVRKRLDKFKGDTLNILPFYENQRKLSRLKGIGSIQEVQNRIFDVLNGAT